MIRRIKLLSVIYLGLFLLLLARLYYWQIVKSETLSERAKSQYQRSKLSSAPRGEILASDGTWLAATVDSYLLYAQPKKIDNIDVISKLISPLLLEKSEIQTDNDLLEMEEARINKILSKKDLDWAALKQNINPETKKEIEKLKMAGLGFELNTTRYFPEGSTAAHLLGFVGKDKNGNDKGYFGLEGYYDITLSGKDGYSSREADLLGNPILINKSKESPTITGISLLTHIDKVIQNDVEKKLSQGVEKYGAIGGSVIVMDPKDGSILAMSSYPAFDPALYRNYGDKDFVNPIVSHSFEPGSIFKVVVMASALDAGLISPDTICDICSGPLKIGKYFIRTWNDKYYPGTSMTEVIVHSDNVGMAFVSQKLGTDKIIQYIEKFGFGQPTGVDLQGEVSPSLRSRKNWGEIDTATASFGQGIAVTPIQMIRAVAAIANKGILNKPRVAEKLIGKNWEEDITESDGVKIISEKAAQQITGMMVEAAKNGESKWTYRKGYKVAGKTGTAQIPIQGHYDEEKTNASFVGFAPYDNPKFIMLVILNEPKSSPWASETSAPLWYSIANDLFDYMGIEPEE